MVEVIIYAVCLGFLLSLIFIGPIFFLVIDTSINKSKTQAVAVSFGGLSADIIFIIIAYFFSKSTVVFFEYYPIISILGGVIIILYGLFFVGNLQSKPHPDVPKDKRMTVYFLKGFGINIVNIGLLFFWLFILSFTGQHFGEGIVMHVFILISLISYIIFEFFKIYHTHKLAKNLKEENLMRIQKIIQFFLVGFGLYIILKELI